MEKLIIILLILIIFLLLSEKFSLKIERKKYSKPLSESQKTPEKPKSSTSVMGKSKFVPPKQENPLTIEKALPEASLKVVQSVRRNFTTNSPKRK